MPAIFAAPDAVKDTFMNCEVRTLTEDSKCRSSNISNDRGTDLRRRVATEPFAERDLRCSELCSFVHSLDRIRCIRFPLQVGSAYREITMGQQRVRQPALRCGFTAPSAYTSPSNPKTQAGIQFDSSSDYG